MVEIDGGYDLTYFRDSEKEVIRERVNDDRVWRWIPPMPTPTPRQNPTPREVIPIPVPTFAPVYTEHKVVTLTFYVCPPFCGSMYGGETVYEGAAACSWEMSIGTRFIIDGDSTGRTYTCEDRGGGPSYNWVDIFFNSYEDGRAWRNTIEVYPTIIIVD